MTSSSALWLKGLIIRATDLVQYLELLSFPREKAEKTAR